MSSGASLRARAWCSLGLMVLLWTPGAAGQVIGYRTWTGNGGTDNWSDPSNWESSEVPRPTDLVEFAPSPTGRRTARQDLASPLPLTGLWFGPSAGSFEVSGNPVRLTAASGVPAIADRSAFGTARVISAPVELDNAIIVEGSTDAGPSNAGLTLRDVSGPGSLTLDSGFLRVGRATYTGPTVVRGQLQIGGWPRNFQDFIVGSTEGQGDYLIEPASPSGSALLSGTGTIGLAPGKSITVGRGGHISPDYFALGPVVAALTVNGDVRFDDGGSYDVQMLYAVPDRLTVNGLLDLTGAGDALNFAGFVPGPGTYRIVVADYQTRLGEFDIFRGSVSQAMGNTNYPATLSYTSASGAGPGQVIVTVTVPEPGGIAAAAAAAGMVLLARRRRTDRRR